MAARLSPHGQVLADSLADGAWHSYHEVIESMAAVVPPGRAFRHAERHRAAHQTRTTGASRPRAVGDESTAVAAGARDVARRLIRARRAEGWLEDRTVDGRRQIRRIQ